TTIPTVINIIREEARSIIEYILDFFNPKSYMLLSLLLALFISFCSPLDILTNLISDKTLPNIPVKSANSFCVFKEYFCIILPKGSIDNQNLGTATKITNVNCQSNMTQSILQPDIVTSGGNT